MTMHFGSAIATSIRLVSFAIVPWVLHWSVPALANPTPVAQGGWNSFAEESSQPAKKDVDNPQNNECLPICIQEGDLFSDRTSCSHFFVCTTVSKSNGSEGPVEDTGVTAAQDDEPSAPYHQLVLLRCSCQSEGDVYNRYLQRCSRRGHCHVSCGDHSLFFSEWKSVRYNGHHCSVMPLLSTSFDAANKVHPQANHRVRANDVITKLMPIQRSPMQSVINVHLLRENESSNSTYSVASLLPSITVTNIPTYTSSNTQTHLLATTAYSVNTPGTVTATGPQSNCNTTLNPGQAGAVESSSTSTGGTHFTNTLLDITSQNYSFITGVTHMPLTVTDEIPSQTPQGFSFITGVTQIHTLTNGNQSLSSQGYSTITGVTHIPTLTTESQLLSSQDYIFITGVTHVPTFTIDSHSQSSQSYSLITGVTHIPTLTTDSLSQSSQSYSFITGVTHTPTLISESQSQSSQSYSFLTGVTHISTLTTESQLQSSQSYSFITGVTQITTLITGSLSQSSQSYSIITGVTHIPTVTTESHSSQNYAFITGVTHLPTLTGSPSQSSQSYSFITGVTHISAMTTNQLQSSESSFITGVTHIPTTLIDESHLQPSQNYSFITGVTNVHSTMTDAIQPVQTIQTSTVLAGATNIFEMVSSIIVSPVLPVVTQTLDSPSVTSPPSLPTSTDNSTLSYTTVQTADDKPETTQNSVGCRPKKCLIPNTRFPNPTNCTKYYKCVLFRGQVVARSYICPSVMPTFSPTLMMCLRGIKCRPSCPQQEVSTVSDVPLATTTEAVNTKGMISETLEYTDPNLLPPGFLVDGEYSKTAVSKVTLDTASVLTGPSYDFSLDTAYTPSNQVSLNLCKFTCSEPYMKAADPTDCHYYYLCKLTEDLTPHPIRIKCPQSHPVFIAETGACANNGSCEVKCHLNNIYVATTVVQPQISTSSLSLPSSQSVTFTKSTILTTLPIINSVTPTPNLPSTSNFSALDEGELTYNNQNKESYQNIHVTSTTQHYETILSSTDNPSECSPTCLVPDSWLPDPTDCHHFYVCHFLNDIISKPRRIACPANRPVFSREEGRCLAKAPCIVTCQTPATIATTELMNTDCNPKCLVPYSSVPDPSDCTRYFICIFLYDLTLEPVRAKCPRTKPFFDPVSKKCEKWARCITGCSRPTVFPAISTEPPITFSSSIEDNCLPQCRIPDTLVHDPKDCQAYYICTLTKSGSLKPIKMQCPEHKIIFDKMTGSCTAEADCNTDCSDTSSSNLTALDNSQTESLLVLTDIQDDTHKTTLSFSNDSSEVPEMEDITGTTPQTSTNESISLNTEDCEPICESHNSITYDPLDCHYYYVCMFTAGKKYVSKVKCPLERPIFHVGTKSCQGNVPCIQICNKIITSQLDLTEASHNISATSSDIINPTAHDLTTTILHSPLGIEETLVPPALLSTTVQSVGEILSTNVYFTENFSDIADYTEDPKTVASVNENNSTTLNDLTAHPLEITSASSSVTPLTNFQETSSDFTSIPHPSEIKCSQECRKQGILLPDLTDCRYYYVCIHLNGLIPQPVRSKCPLHSPIFDTGTSQCVADGVCHNPCSNSSFIQDESSKETTPAVSPTVTPDPCLPSCQTLNSVIPDPSDCHFYYYCTLSNGMLTPVRMKCPTGRPIFNINYLTCSSNIPCVASCKKLQSHIPNPSSQIISLTSSITYCPYAGYFASSERCISSYDYCYHQGDKILKTRKQCPKGLVFNPISTYPYCVSPHDCPYDPQKYGPTANATYCRHPGRFPKCKDCCSDFIQCQPAPQDTYRPVIVQCSGGLVFNTDPIYPVCLRKADCPTGSQIIRECKVQGNYPSCPLGNCCRNYNHCTHDGRLQQRTCPYPFVFNNHPSYPYCILAWNCPYISPL